jgi:DNA ligase (NAD+)
MIATNINKFKKTRKNQKVKAGPCIFPFRYKWKTHTKCYSEEDGDICATEINPVTKTLIKYGYCQESSKNDLTRKESSKNDSSKNKNKETIKKKSKSKSRSPINQTQKKSKSKSPIKDKGKQPIMETGVQPDKSLNKKIVDALGELNKLMLQRGEPFRARAYQRAQQEVYKYREPITNIDQIRDLPNIGATILNKLRELESTGKIEAIERERAILAEEEKKPINIFAKIYGIGPKRAKELVDKGITTITQLKLPENQKLLNDKQKIGLNYYYDILERIPRAEIEEYKTLFQQIFREESKKVDGESSFEIVGSYRRQAETSGDIDLIITNSRNNNEIFRLFLDRLIKDNIIIEVLSRGSVKSLTIGRLPTGSSTDPPRLARRIDLLYSPSKEYPFAILYFTGSQEFNTVMRERANTQGYTLNEHGISYKSQGIKGDIIDTTDKIKTESDIFDFFNMEYKTPVERRDGYAVVDRSQESAFQREKLVAPRQNKTQKRTPEERLENSREKIEQQIEQFQKAGISTLDMLTESELIQILRHADQEYYCNTNPVLTDSEYDVLREHIVKKYPDNPEADAGHEKCEIKKNRITLPYEMWSMDKIKPDSNALARYQQKFTGPYVLSCKLDGVSALYTITSTKITKSTDNSEQRLYTRGNGRIGTDISHLIPYLKLPSKATTGDLVIRGELIMKRATFDARYKSEFKNPRNLVAGLVNNRTITEARKQMYRDLDFVAYEVIKPDSLKPSIQMDYLSALDPLIVVQNKTIPSDNLTNEQLSELLVEWRREYIYEIDGIICADDRVYPRIPSRNPEHAFAFKMVLSDQSAEARVVDVIWTPSKDGYLKPRVQIEPVTLGGVTITYLTGKNARFIRDRKIGVGAIIRIIRSGDVIPEIEDRDDVVIQPAETPLFPPESEYVWNQTGVDIMLADKTANTTVAVKTIANFFKHLQVDGIGEGIVKRLVTSGFNTIAKVLAMSHADFLKIEGVKDRLATKLTTNIRMQLQAKSLAEIAAATNIFGRGLGQQRIETILEHEPNIFLQTQQLTQQQLIDRVKKIPGMAQKTATQFVEHLPEFIEFIETANLQQQLDQPDQQQPDQPNQQQNHELYKKKIVMTGFRDKELEARLKQIGAQIKNNVTRDTYVVLVKDLDEDTGKANLARENNIPLMLPEEFRIIHNL